ncbi:3-hydroxyisobutyrate dehydrogenase [Fistulina hepatica ATCC 64428]|nr:3-hydroxyisobutyrate dehydrogenase [Fistulina hepatica ATCC 64428]
MTNDLDVLQARSSSISFIGLGRMGAEMAFNLFAKRHVSDPQTRFVVCDAIPENAFHFCRKFISEHPQAKISIAETPTKAALASQTVMTMLPSSPEVSSVYEGSVIPVLSGLPRDAAEVTLCIDSTTLDVTVARKVASSVLDTGASMIDAPVSGGVVGAKAGTLTFLVGGAELDFLRAKPLLAMMGQRIVHCGSSGAGLGAKICNNLMLGVQQVVTAEAMLLGQAMGLDPQVLASVIGSSTGGCWSISTNNPVVSALHPDKNSPCERDYEGGFAMALILKDMKLASRIATLAGSPIPLGKTAEEMYEKIMEERPELKKKDFSSVYLYLRDNMSKS